MPAVGDAVEAALEAAFEARRSAADEKAVASNVLSKVDAEEEGHERRRRLESDAYIFRSSGTHSPPAACGCSVLYEDYAGYFAPLFELYFSLDLKALVSSHPLSMQIEAETFFCPHLCSFFCYEAEAHSSAGRCPRCYCCPVCGSVLAVRPINWEDGDSAHCMACTYCSWTSELLGLVDADVEAISMLAATEEAEDQLSKQFAEVLKRLRCQAVAASREASLSRTPVGAERGSLARLNDDGVGAIGDHMAAACESYGEDGKAKAPSRLWASLESRLRQSKQEVAAAKGSPSFVSLAQESALSPADDLEATIDVHKIMKTEAVAAGSVLASLDQRLAQPLSLQREMDFRMLRPQRLRLRSRCAKRCRADVEAGRAGILMKPKVNPEEGDSSHSGRQGQWFKKDCSAIHSIPAVSVAHWSSQHVLLRLSNPSDAQVWVQLEAAQENHWPPGIRCTHIEPISSEWMQLEAQEDEFLSSGGEQDGKTATPNPDSCGDVPVFSGPSAWLRVKFESSDSSSPSAIALIMRVKDGGADVAKILIECRLVVVLVARQ
jgi:hypothetical protein